MQTKPVTLDWTGETVQLDGHERHLSFGGDDHQVVLTIRQEAVASTDSETATPIPFWLLLHHRTELRTDGLQVRVRAPPRDGSAFDAAVYLGAFSTDVWPALTITRDAHGWTVIDCGALGQTDVRTESIPGAANVTLDFMVVPTTSHPVDDLFIEVEASLSKRAAVGRRTFRLHRMATFPIVKGSTSG